MIATDEADKQNMKVATDSEFAQTLKRIFRERRPRRILETGTHLGTGTTRIIGEAIREAGLTGVEFISIEVNPQYASQARANTAAAGIAVDLRHGLSVPRSLLPTPEQVHQEYVERVDPSVFVDHAEQDRVKTYLAETDFPGTEDDLLGKALRAWGGRPDFVLLDSAGHMGIIEYEYALTLIKGPCTLMLDDTRHVKHAKSVARMKQDPRFTIEADSPEKFGFVAASYKPRRGGGILQRIAGVFGGRK
ncbi:MAG: hypothetical protein JWP03_1221 [Phycisphaerales bacterium]|jgi:hypothetical protein|nr:hypothetical protein [Phycisphaerales bacterium]